MTQTIDILCPNVSGKYGAPMGRMTQDGGFRVLDNAKPFNLIKIPLDSGGYDKGGAYWGLRLNGESLYGFLGPVDDIRGFVDAKTRDDAKKAVIELHPLAGFYK